MTGYPWTIHVRDSRLQLVGELDDYQSADLLLKFNDVSTWQLKIARANRLALDLCQPGAGIVVTRNGTTILSGAWQKQNHKRGANENTVTLSGEDDTRWLRKRQAHPQPGTDGPPYSTSAEDVWTGTASSVMQLFVQRNAGVNAIVQRRVLTAAADPGYGISLTGRARWQPLLTLLQGLAVEGAENGIPVGFKVIQVGAGLQYVSYEPVDRTGIVVFSEALGNLQEWTYERAAPDATYWYVGGLGEGTARTIYERPDSAALATWDRMEGDFVDARSAANAAELSQAAVKANADAAEQYSFAVTPIDTDTQQFGVHYGLGDRVSGVLAGLGPGGGSVPGDMVQDVLRQCRIQLAPDKSTVTPAVGTEKAGVGPAIRMFDKQRAAERRLNNLERR